MAVGEWDQRQLCPDGSCIGVIGPDGTCKVCGRAAPNWGDERKRGLIDPDEQEERDIHDEDDDDDDEGDDEDEHRDDDGEADDDDDEDGGEDDDDDKGIAASGSAVAAQPGAWSARQLCSDGACIGVIGPDGYCRVCGRAASGVADKRSASEARANEADAEANGDGAKATEDGTGANEDGTGGKGAA